MGEQRQTGKHPGGRPVGTKAPRTVLAEKMKERMKRKIYRHWNEIIDTALELARGDYYLQKIEVDNGKDKERQRRPTYNQDLGAPCATHTMVGSG